MSCIARRWWRDWTELSLGWKLLNVNLKNLNFSVTLIPTFPSRGSIQKTQTETAEDPDWNNISFFCILINFHHLDHLANHQKLNIIYKNEYFIFWWLRGLLSHFSWLSLLRLLGRSPDIEHNPKTSMSLFLAGEGWQMGFESIDQPGQSSEFERNPKMSISLFWLERSGGWGLSPPTSLADHQKLNIIQKWTFHFFGWRGVADGVWVHRPARPIIRIWM